MDDALVDEEVEAPTYEDVLRAGDDIIFDVGPSREQPYMIWALFWGLF